MARDDSERVEGSRSVVSDPSDLPGLPDPPALPAPVSVTTYGLEIVSIEAETVTLRVHCSAGFYIRSLAHDLGERLGVGAHLTALRRTRVGDFDLERAVDLEMAERDPSRAAESMVTLGDMLPQLAAVMLTTEGVARALHGQDVRPSDQFPALSAQPSAIAHEPSATSHQPFVRLLNPAGELVAVAQPIAASSLLHPALVLV